MRKEPDRAAPQDEADTQPLDHSAAPPLVRRSPPMRTGGAGPPTGPGNRTSSGLRWRRAAALLGSALAVAAVGTPVVMSARGQPAGQTLAQGTDAPPSSAPAAGSGGQADVDGDGRTEKVTIDGPSIVVASGPHAGRYRIGEPSGTVLVADVDCDGTATPVVHRPDDGQVFVFPKWPDAGSVTPQVLDVPAGETLVVTRDDGCDVLQVGGRPVG